jgi:hypothetical protein
LEHGFLEDTLNFCTDLQDGGLDQSQHDGLQILMILFFLLRSPPPELLSLGLLDIIDVILLEAMLFFGMGVGCGIG